jgi:transcriptional regulator with XRE-family HTH domain
MKQSEHPLKTLREGADLTQAEIAQLTGISTTRISLAENHLATFTDEQTQKIRNAIVEAVRDRSANISHSADPRLASALEEIERSPSKLKIFETLKERRGFSELEAAIAVLGRRYPIQIA